MEVTPVQGEDREQEVLGESQLAWQPTMGPYQLGQPALIPGSPTTSQGCAGICGPAWSLCAWLAIAGYGSTGAGRVP